MTKIQTQVEAAEEYLTTVKKGGARNKQLRELAKIEEDMLPFNRRASIGRASQLRSRNLKKAMEIDGVEVNQVVPARKVLIDNPRLLDDCFRAMAATAVAGRRGKA